MLNIHNLSDEKWARQAGFQCCDMVDKDAKGRTYKRAYDQEIRMLDFTVCFPCPRPCLE